MTVKKIFLSAIAILFIATFSKAQQDTSLPQGDSRIYLYSGKTIKRVQLWKIDPSKVEFVKDGNLADILTTDVQKIETKDYVITFDDESKMIKRKFDLVVPYSGDTIRCIIQTDNGGTISFVPAGSNNRMYMMKSSLKTYVNQKDIPETAPPDILEPQKQDTVSTAAHVDTSGLVKSGNDTAQMPAAIKDSSDIIKAHVAARQKEEELKAKSAKIQETYYYRHSYERGVSDAAARYEIGWGAAGFCLGPTGCFPFLSLAAAESTVDFDKVSIPSGVDAQLYMDGYENQVVKMRTAKTGQGGSIAIGILCLFAIILLMSSN